MFDSALEQATGAAMFVRQLQVRGRERFTGWAPFGWGQIFDDQVYSDRSVSQSVTHMITIGLAAHAEPDRLSAINGLLEQPMAAEIVAQAVALEGHDLSAQERLLVVRLWERAGAWVEAKALDASAGFAAECEAEQCPAAESTAAVELGWVFGGDGWRGADALDLATALGPQGRLAALGDPVRSGDLPMRYVRLVHRETQRLDDEGCRRVADAMMHRLRVRRDRRTGALLPPQWRTWRDAVRRAVMRIDPEAASGERHDAVRTRGASIRRHRDGTATVSCTLPAIDATGVWETLTVAAEQARAGDGEQRRTLDQARADAFSALFADVAGAGQRDPGALLPALSATTPVTVGILIDLPTLLGLQDNPGELPGFGPLDPELVRILAGDAQWRRFITDPLTGDLLDAGRDRYRPSRALRDFVSIRHPRCTLPGCTRSARHAQLDHITPWPDGATTRDNLHPVCQRDHNRKTLEGWSVSREPDGRIAWRSPHGLHAAADPPPWLEPAPCAVTAVLGPPADPDPPPF